MDFASPSAKAFLKATATAMATFAGHDVSALDADVKALLFAEQSLVIPDETADADLQKYYGSRLKPLFTIHKDNVSTNYGSFGISPTYVMAMKQLAIMTQEQDTDKWVRLLGPSAYRQMREAMAAYLNTPVKDGLSRVADAHQSTTTERRGSVDPDEVFIVDNLADGMNVVARSFLCNFQFPLNGNKMPDADNKQQSTPPDERVILYFANQYPMVKQAIRFYSELVAGAVVFGPKETESTEEKESSRQGEKATALPTVRLIEVPMTPEMVFSSDEASPAIASVVAEAVSRHRADALVMDHFCWAPTFVMPVEAICRAVRAVMPNCFIVIDGAHAIGQLSLAHLFSHGGESKNQPKKALFDVYVANCHKWLMTPRSAAVLWVDASHQTHLHPSIISNQYRGFSTSTSELSTRPSKDNLLDKSHTSVTQAEFYWCGTRDMSHWMVLPHVLRYRAECLGGEGPIMRHNRWLAREGARICAASWGTHALLDEADGAVEQNSDGRYGDTILGALVCVKAPTDDGGLNAQACREVLEHHNAFAPPVTFNNRQYIRLSAQVYNCVNDYHFFAKVYLDVLRRSEVKV